MSSRRTYVRWHSEAIGFLVAGHPFNAPSLLERDQRQGRGDGGQKLYTIIWVVQGFCSLLAVHKQTSDL